MGLLISSLVSQEGQFGLHVFSEASVGVDYSKCCSVLSGWLSNFPMNTKYAKINRKLYRA